LSAAPADTERTVSQVSSGPNAHDLESAAFNLPVRFEQLTNVGSRYAGIHIAALQVPGITQRCRNQEGELRTLP
jgi:hypothetical protein